MTMLYELGVRYFFGSPPGKVLTGLIHESFKRVTARSLNKTPIETVAYLAKRARITL